MGVYAPRPGQCPSRLTITLYTNGNIIKLFAISFACGCFLLSLLATRLSVPTPLPTFTLLFSLVIAFAAIYVTPGTVGTDLFLRNLLTMHAILFMPLVESFWYVPTAARGDRPWRLWPTFQHVYLFSAAVSMAHQILSTLRVWRLAPETTPLRVFLWDVAHTHPAQASISYDLVWTTVLFTAFMLLDWRSAGAKNASGPVMVAVWMGTPLLGIAVTAPAYLAWREGRIMKEEKAKAAAKAAKER